VSFRRVVVISDLHAHPWAAFAHGDGLENDRLRRTLGVLRASLQRAQELDCPWVFGGDLVHTAGYALNVVLSALAEEFGRFPDVAKLAVWGNHDARGVGGKIVLEQTIWAALSRSVSNLMVLDPSLSQPIVERGGITFSGVGAQPRPDLLRAPLQSDVGVYHATVRGSHGPNGYIFPYGIEADDLLSRHKVSIAGDLHHPQCISRAEFGAHILLVPGSPEHHNFGDALMHGWWIVNVDPPAAAITPSGSPEFRTVETAADVHADGNFYRVLTRSVGEQLPENATVVAPTPTTIENRTALRGLTGEQILAGWIAANPPSDVILTTEGAAAMKAELLALGRQLLSLDDVGQLSNVRLTWLGLRNFCSYAEADFPVLDGTWLVLGKGRDYPSNGAGKSTLFESLFWLLFGRTTKGLTGDEVIRWGAKDCSVHAIFENSYGGVLEVKRTRGEASRLEVYEGDDSIPWEATSVNEMTEKLNRHLGVTPELFQALGYFSQERVLLFASATDGERKEMLADLIGLSAYQSASAAAQKRIEQLKVDLAANDGLQRGTEEHLIAARVTMEQMQQRFLQWNEEHEQRRLAALAALDTFDASVQHTFEQLAAEAVKQLSQTNEQNTRVMREHLAQAEIELSKPYPPVASAADLRSARKDAEEARMAVIRFTTQIAETTRQLETAHRKLDEIVKLTRDGTCPSCGQQIQPEHRERCEAPIRNEIQVLNDLAAKLQQSKADAVETAAAWKLTADSCEHGVAAAEAIARWSDQRQAAKDGLQQLEEEAARISEVAKQHVTKVLDDKRAELKRAIALVDRETNPHRQSEAVAVGSVKEAEARLEKRKQEQLSMALQAALHDYWRVGFSKQGIQSLLMDEVAGAFNAARGAIFPALTQGVYDVQFSTLSRTKGGDQRERTEFKVYEHGLLVPYEALSGGQRRRIDVGVMLTLVKAISTWMHVPGALGVLVLDEVFGFLDASGAEGLMEALRDVQAVVPTIYAISHDPQLQALFSGTVMIEQDDFGVSRIVTGGERNGGLDPSEMATVEANQ